VQLYPECADRTRVIWHGLDHVLRVPALDATSEEYLSTLHLPERYVLYAGSLDARKNVSALLDACVLLEGRRERIPVVLVGQKWFGSGSVERRIDRLRREGLDLRPLGYQPESILYGLMRRASLFVFPSRYEGFGLPPLEAMRLGVPTLVSRTGALTEVCGTGAETFDPDSPEELAAVLSRLWSSDRARKKLGALGKRHAESFTWARAAEKTLDVYREALGETSSST
jgi:glycosyltransferase involved in cell wall biosynthesis